MQNFDTQHPDFTAYLPRYIRSRSLYEGGSLIEGQSGYLPRHPFESDAQYTIRLTRSTYRNFAAPIADTFASAVVSGVVDRKVPTKLEALVQDADKAGTSARMFFEQVVFTAAAVGLEYVLVDMPPKGDSQSAADDAKLGRRPYFVRLKAEDVIDWQFGADNRLEWAVVSQKILQPRQPGVEPEYVTHITVWTRTDWKKYQLTTTTTAGKSETAQTLVSEGQNEIGVVPIVPFYFEKQGHFVGTSAFDSVASVIRFLFFKLSELDKQEFDTCVPMMMLTGVSSEDMDGFVSSTSNAFYTSNEAAGAKYIEPTGDSNQNIKDTIERNISWIQEIALRQNRQQTGQVQSAKAKELDNKQLETQMKSLATQCENAELDCWKLAGKWVDVEIDESVVSTKYNDDYSTFAAQLERVALMLEMGDKGYFSKQTVLEDESVRRVVGTVDYKEEQIKISQELPTAIGPSGGGIFGNV